MTEPASKNIPDGNSASDTFLAERVSLLYRFALQDVIALLFAAGVTAFALWEYVEARLMVLWLAWIITACAVRFILHQTYLHLNPPPEAAQTWETRFTAAGAFLGAGWGACILLAFPTGGNLYQILVPSMICTLALGMPSALAPSPKSFAALLGPILAPLVSLLFTNGGFNSSAAMLLLVFTGVLLALYLGANHTLMETLRFGRENVELTNKLRATDRSLAEALSELRIIFDSAAVGLALIRDQRITRCNEAFARLFGYAAAEMANLHARSLHPTEADWEQAHGAAIVRFEQGQAWGAECELSRKDGQLFWGSIEARTLDPSHPGGGIIYAVHDVSMRKHAEQELMASLQREKELNEMKTRFVSTVSHEFRTPLSTILSSAELLRLYPDKLDGEEKINLLSGVEDATKRMRKLLDEVLTLGRAESGVLRLQPTPLALSELCSKVVHDLCIGEGKQHTILFENRFERPTAELDENLLRHILNNLLANAIKYSEPGTTVKLTLEEQHGNVHICVEDNGIGIPAEDQAHLFQSFHRASNVKNRQGTGLGLAIVKKSVELHGGSITFDSKVNVGTRFDVILPLQPQTAVTAS